MIKNLPKSANVSDRTKIMLKNIYMLDFIHLIEYVMYIIYAEIRI